MCCLQTQSATCMCPLLSRLRSIYNKLYKLNKFTFILCWYIIRAAKRLFFYRVTHMHSADYAVGRCLYVSVHPSVRHTPVLCVNTKQLHITSKFFHHRIAILVFPHQTGWQYSDGDPPNGGAECKGYEKITICNQYRALSRNWCKIET